ncbi:winged helix-turn-helix domain-containing protein [Yersinia massiliensis]|uniref:winged helix-turn-helix domain-containing protein n=1 Tax=Yersinia massiliensis TaxID=419257 RepID=UPI0002E72F70|nr:winged helix-turn-helix domain-containing protein [Yersinia massiliensis]MCB5309578.1 winged helix-turn-helix domain-containing protein [Yersinia massiliensis]
MNYNIDNKIIYQEENGRLCSIIAPENTVRLSITPARILSYLLENKDRIINRAEILEKVWDEYGLQSSNNSLSQNISLLRKSLRELGYIEEIILTVPKVGFRISENVIIETELPLSQDQIEIEDSSHSHEMLPPPKRKRRWASYILLITLIVASILLTTLFAQLVDKENMDIVPEAKLYPIGNIGQCPAFTLDHYSEKLVASKLQLATELANKHLPCIDNAIYIFKLDDNYIQNHSGRIFLSLCSISKLHDSSFSNCQDVYIYEN